MGENPYEAPKVPSDPGRPLVLNPKLPRPEIWLITVFGISILAPVIWIVLT